jgi:hypothetical protein
MVMMRYVLLLPHVCIRRLYAAHGLLLLHSAAAAEHSLGIGVALA